MSNKGEFLSTEDTLCSYIRSSGLPTIKTVKAFQKIGDLSGSTDKCKMVVAYSKSVLEMQAGLVDFDTQGLNKRVDARLIAQEDFFIKSQCDLLSEKIYGVFEVDEVKLPPLCCQITPSQECEEPKNCSYTRNYPCFDTYEEYSSFLENELQCHKPFMVCGEYL